MAIFERLFVNTHFNKWSNEKVNWQILPQENLYLKTDGTVYNDVEFVTHSELKTNLVSLYLVPSLLGFGHRLYPHFDSAQKKKKERKRKFLNAERALGTEKEWAAFPIPPYKGSFHHVQHLGEDSHWLSVSRGPGARLVILDSASALVVEPSRSRPSCPGASGFAGKMEGCRVVPGAGAHFS